MKYKVQEETYFHPKIKYRKVKGQYPLPEEMCTPKSSPKRPEPIKRPKQK